MKRYEANSICANCNGFVTTKFHEVIEGKWIEYSETESIINKLTNLNNILTEGHRKTLRHAMHLGDKLEKIYSDLRVVNKSLIAKDYIAAEELLTEILEGE